MRIGITGHRPSKLWGYDLTSPQYEALRSILRETILQSQCDMAYTGMALGVDQIFAEEILQLKQQGHNITLCACIPFLGQQCKWPAKAQEHYRVLCSKCDSSVCVCQGNYASWKLQKRNEYIVDRVDKLIAVWNGEPNGGTFNCIKYALENNVETVIIHSTKL